jgi:hypothetical protein
VYVDGSPQIPSRLSSNHRVGWGHSYHDHFNPFYLNEFYRHLHRRLSSAGYKCLKANWTGLGTVTRLSAVGDSVIAHPNQQ